jgi:hypothetical protein
MLVRIDDKYSRHLTYWLYAHRYRDSMNLTQALKGNMREPEKGKKRIFQVVGLHHSNDEVRETSQSKGCGSFK